METVPEAIWGMGGESTKRRRAEDNSSGKIDDESATTEEISENEKAKCADIDREMLAEAEAMGDYRRSWESKWRTRCFSFEQETTLSSMVATHDTNIAAWPETALQVYSIKVEEAELKWPLHLYGTVAARDTVDNKRNLLFNRERDGCQIITKNDPFLLLTGPSRAIVFLDPVMFEINLKVKGESEDKETLIQQTYRYNGPSGSHGTSCSNKLCEINLNFMELDETVQATIMSVQIISGSWPSPFAGEVFCRDGSSLQKVVLLDFPN